MDRLDAMAIFVTTVEEGSLAAAARRLGRSAPAITRAIALLEAGTGERLLNRNTRSLALTEAGQQHLEIYRRVLAALAEIDDARRPRGTVRGRIKLTAPELFGRLRVMPVLEGFLRAYPDVSARFLCLNRVVDLVGEGIDVAVRLAHLPDSGLAAVRLGELRKIVCAAPAYLSRAARPAVPADLADHDCIVISDSSEQDLWPFVMHGTERDRPRSIPIRSRLAVSSAGAALDATLRGEGVGQLMAYQVAEPIASGQLVPLLTAFETPPVPVSFVFHANPAPGSPVRAFLDYAAPLLRQELLRIGALVPSGAPVS